MEAHREAAAVWFAAANGVIDQLVADAERLHAAARNPSHPLAKILDSFMVKELAQGLGNVSCDLASATPRAKCPVPLPSPFPA